ncbi:MAG: hypothetical protein EPN74_12170 [Rhodanobacter sp.]|nr:MAG: hypothetical protein EPN74_12170 [Rhodanobacter sp.]
MKISPKIIVATVALGLSMAVTTVYAQESAMHPASGMQHADKSMMHHGMKHMNKSMHKMPATVTSVDHKTGIVEVNSAGMSLRVHFPPPSVASLKAGDKITLHLGFTR